MNSVCRISLIIIVFLFFACTCGDSEHQEVHSQVVTIDGSCDAAPIAYTKEGREPRRVGKLSQYRVKLRVRENSMGHLRVRSNPVWPADDLSNVIGTIPAGITVLADGPLKNQEFSAGIGYAVAVKDRDGRLCQGYIADTGVSPIE